VSGSNARAADGSTANHRQESQDETLAAARGFLRASLLSAGIWLLIGGIIYWLS
jgi:hypothetical protein